MNASTSQKLISIVQKKLSTDQNILSILQKIYYFPVKNPTGKKTQDSLIISTHNLYFIYSGQIKKIVLIKHIIYMTLAILGNQMILHSEKGDWVRLESLQIISIIGNILLAKQRFLQEKDPFTVHLEIQKTLQNFTQAEHQKKSIFSIFKKIDKKSLTASGRRVSFCTIEVNEKNFILQIGKKSYKAIFQNAQLLHISGNASGFRFDAQNYQYRDLSQTDTLYWRQDEEGKALKRFLRRKVNKIAPYETQGLRKLLSNYRYNDYNEDILFALELDTHFQILTEVTEGWTYCWEYLIHHKNYQRSLANGVQSVPQQILLTQTQLRSIFRKLHTFIEDQSHKNSVLCSLSLDYVYISNGESQISTAFCKILSRTNISYIAPQEFKYLERQLRKIEKMDSNKRGSFVELKDMQSVKKIQQQKKIEEIPEETTPIQTYKTNLWKLGMFLYQLAYHKLPFPIEYVAYKVKNHQHIKVHFPERDSRSIEFHHFLKCLICKDPLVRGMRVKGDARMSILNPQITNILQHQWIVKKSQK